MDFLSRFKGKISTIGKDGELGLVAGSKSNLPFSANSTVTVMTNIDHLRNSQMNYQPKIKQSPFTQYGQYGDGSEVGSMVSPKDVGSSVIYDASTAGESKYVASSQNVKEFRSSNGIRINDLKAENNNPDPNLSSVPSFQKMKNKLETMRKQNLNNAANNILYPNKIVENSIKKDIAKVKNIDIKNTKDDNEEEKKLNIEDPPKEIRIEPVRKSRFNEDNNNKAKKSNSLFRAKKPPIPKGTGRKEAQEESNINANNIEIKYKIDTSKEPHTDTDVPKNYKNSRLKEIKDPIVKNLNADLELTKALEKQEVEKKVTRRSQSYVDNEKSNNKGNKIIESKINSRNVFASAENAETADEILSKERKSANYKPYTAMPFVILSK